MKKCFVLLLTGSAMIGGAACTGSSASFTAPSAIGATDSALDGRSSVPTIAGLAVATPDLSTLVAALQKANLVATFDGNRHFTVFAPTNAAFDAAAVALLGAGKTGVDLVNGLDVPTLTSVLSYHVTRGDRKATSVLAAGSLVMLDNNTTTISVVNDAARIDNATIVMADVQASNGIVHVIDAVLLPPSLR
jgi:uncharacterized surface protein with fasciclin (FAS1) repeats